MGITVLLDAPLYSGAPTTSGLVPGLYDVALNGRPFRVQLEPEVIGRFNLHFSRQSLPLVRDQADSGDVPGEHSVSPEQFWRRSVESWHQGAGQTYYDRKTSLAHRFHTSKGVNPWTPWSLTLLNDTSKTRASANTGLLMCKAGARIYLIDGTGASSVLFSTDAAAWTATTGAPAAAPVSICSDGYSVYVAYGASGVYSTNTSTGAVTSLATGTVAVLGYAKGRLMAANGPSLYNITAAGALPAPVTTHRDSNWTWVGFAEGQQHIFAAGYSGGHSEVYRIAVADTGSVLGAATVAGTLPEGETVTGIYGYLGFLAIGTSKGVRFAVPDSAGNLNIGQLIATGQAVYGFNGSDRFIWFGWTNYDTGSSGLGRMDLSTFTSPLLPAYATDLMAAGQGAVRSAVTLGSATVFTVDGVGVFKETVGTPVASGTVTSGLIGYDIADAKVAAYLDLRHDPLPSGCKVTAGVAYDNGTTSNIGSSAATNSTQPAPFYLNGTRAERFETTLTLAGSGATGPILTRWTLRASPAPATSSLWTVPLVIADEQLTPSGIYKQDARADYEALVSLHDTQTLFTYQEGNNSYLVKMADFDWLPQKPSAENAGDWNGTFVAKLQEITG